MMKIYLEDGSVQECAPKDTRRIVADGPHYERRRRGSSDYEQVSKTNVQKWARLVDIKCANLVEHHEMTTASGLQRVVKVEKN